MDKNNLVQYDDISNTCKTYNNRSIYGGELKQNLSVDVGEPKYNCIKLKKITDDAIFYKSNINVTN